MQSFGWICGWVGRQTERKLNEQTSLLFRLDIIHQGDTKEIKWQVYVFQQLRMAGHCPNSNNRPMDGSEARVQHKHTLFDNFPKGSLAFSLAFLLSFC
jgi:hypothetical protein